MISKLLVSTYTIFVSLSALFSFKTAILLYRSIIKFFLFSPTPLSICREANAFNCYFQLFFFSQIWVCFKFRTLERFPKLISILYDYVEYYNLKKVSIVKPKRTVVCLY